MITVILIAFATIGLIAIMLTLGFLFLASIYSVYDLELTEDEETE